MRLLGIILAVAGLLLAGGMTLFYPITHPPLTQVQELERSTARLNALTGAQVDMERLEQLERAGQIDPARVETRSHLTMLGLGMGGIGALLILAGAITTVARRQQV